MIYIFSDCEDNDDHDATIIYDLEDYSPMGERMSLSSVSSADFSDFGAYVDFWDEEVQEEDIFLDTFLPPHVLKKGLDKFVPLLSCVISVSFPSFKYLYLEGKTPKNISILFSGHQKNVFTFPRLSKTFLRKRLFNNSFILLDELECVAEGSSSSEDDDVFDDELF